MWTIPLFFHAYNMAVIYTVHTYMEYVTCKKKTLKLVMITFYCRYEERRYTNFKIKITKRKREEM